jgi:hypothetical protein
MRLLGAGLELGGDGEDELEFDGTVLADNEFLLDNSTFAMVGLDSVFTRGKSGENEVSVAIRDGEVGMIEKADVAKFPRMNIALQAHVQFRN